MSMELSKKISNICLLARGLAMNYHINGSQGKLFDMTAIHAFEDQVQTLLQKPHE